MPNSNRSKSSRASYHSSSRSKSQPQPQQQPQSQPQQQPQKGTYSRTADFISNTLSTAGGFLIGSVLVRSIFGSSEQNNQTTQPPYQNKDMNEDQYQIDSKCRELFKVYSNCMMKKREQGFDMNDKNLCSDELKALNKCQKNEKKPEIL